jgi:hypothetical protein
MSKFLRTIDISWGERCLIDIMIDGLLGESSSSDEGCSEENPQVAMVPTRQAGKRYADSTQTSHTHFLRLGRSVVNQGLPFEVRE